MSDSLKGRIQDMRDMLVTRLPDAIGCYNYRAFTEIVYQFDIDRTRITAGTPESERELFEVQTEAVARHLALEAPAGMGWWGHLPWGHIVERYRRAECIPGLLRSLSRIEAVLEMSGLKGRIQYMRDMLETRLPDAIAVYDFGTFTEIVDQFNIARTRDAASIPESERVLFEVQTQAVARYLRRGGQLWYAVEEGQFTGEELKDRYLRAECIPGLLRCLSRIEAVLDRTDGVTPEQAAMQDGAAEKEAWDQEESDLFNRASLVRSRELGCFGRRRQGGWNF